MSENHAISIKFNLNIAEQNGIFHEDDQYVMYILINDELKMDINRTIKFCCHSVCKVVIENENLTVKQKSYSEWVNNDEPIIILKANESDLIFCVNEYSDMNKYIWCQNIIDLNKTDISPFSLTTIAFSPMMRKEAPDIIKNLKKL